MATAILLFYALSTFVTAHTPAGTACPLMPCDETVCCRAGLLVRRFVSAQGMLAMHTTHNRRAFLKGSTAAAAAGLSFVWPDFPSQRRPRES
jgi:hypothetical protein